MNLEIKKLENELDLNFYMSMNNDVAIRFNFDYELIKDHFFKFGYSEKRLYSKIESNLFYFNDWIKYLNSNKDIVKNNVNNEFLAFKHYLEHGQKEKRKIFPKKIIKYETFNLPIDSKYEIIDIEFTKKMNEDLQNMTENEIIYYIDDSIKNNKFLLFSLNHRNLYENFDWNQYLIDYPDLKINNIFTKKDAIYHYIKFGSVEGRNLKSMNFIKKFIDNSIKNNEKDNDENNEKDIDQDNENENDENNIKTTNTSINFLNQINENDENLFENFKNNILDNSNNLDFEKYNINNHNQIDKIYECLCLDFDYKYYYKLNSEYHELKNNEDSCMEHFMKYAAQYFLPYSKNHYLLWLNYRWDIYAEQKNLSKNNYYLAFLDYIKNKYYLNKNVDLPEIKYNLNYFINNFYCIAYEQKSENICISYKNFLKNENKEKIFPNLFNYFLYSIIDWKLFVIDNKLESMKIFELINLLKKSNYDFSKYKVVFNSIINLNIPDKKSIVNLSEFNDFYNKIICYIKNNNSIHNFSEINKQFNKLFNKNLFNIPKNFKFLNVLSPSKQNNLNFNFIINYINKFESLHTLLLSIFYQNHINYNIIILNKCNDPDLEEKIEKIKKSLNISNNITIISNEFLLENIKIYNNIKNNNIDDFIKLKNNLKVFDINILIDTNHYLSNNNILENLNNNYDDNNYLFEKILVEKNESKKNFKYSFIVLNSNTLLNNLYLLYNYYNYQFDENLINIIKDNIILNDLNFVDNTFYNLDFEINDTFINKLPIYILYENKDNLVHIKNLLNYNVIEIIDNEYFTNFINYINDNNIYNNIIIINIDRILENFSYINFDLNYEDFKTYNLINIFNSKKKNIKNTSKTIPKINTYEAYTINYDLRKKYLKSYKV